MLIFFISISMAFTLASDYLFAQNTSSLSDEEQILPDAWMCSGFLKKIRFVKDQVYGDTEEVFLGRIGDVDVDSENRVYIADMGNVSIQVYNPDGSSYSASIGQHGRGPGEFQNVTHYTKLRVKSNKIFITGTDWIFSDKVQVFSLNDYSLSDEILFRESEKKAFDPDLENYFPKNVYPLENERLLVSYEHIRSSEYIKRDENKILYYLHDQTGSIITGPVLEQKDRTNLYQVYEGNKYNYYAFPFFGKSLLSVSKDGLLYTAFSDEFSN
ncbi:MAG: 6-bladed beta-propeller [Balneolaceae bacterium]